MSSGAPKETGIPVRYPSVALLVVDSNDQHKFDSNGFRIDSSNPSRIYINKQSPMMVGYMTRLALTEMNIQWDTPNVNDSNNTLTMALYEASDATPPVITLIDYIRITIASKFYTPSELADAVETALNANSTVSSNGLEFSVTYQEQFGAFFIQQLIAHPSGRTAGYFKIVSGSSPKSLTGFNTVADDLLFCMGIQPRNTSSPYSSLYGSYAPMVYTPYIDVVSNLLTKNQNVNDGSSSAKFTSSKLARIYFSNETIINRYDNVLSGETVTTPSNIIGTRPITFRREFITPKQIQWNATENVDVIDIEVLDYKGNPIVLQEQVVVTSGETNQLQAEMSNNTSFQFTIQVTEV